MATVDELLAMQDLLISGNETFVADTKYPVYTLYNDPVYVTISNKVIADFNSQISIRGEQNAQFVSFVMPRYSDGMDLVGMQLYIHYESSQGAGDNMPCNVEYSAASIRLSWLIPAAAAQSAEAIQFMVYALGYNEKGEPYKWLTLPARYEIKDGLEIGGSIAEPDTGWYEQFVWSMDQKIATALGHSNTAKGYANNAKTSQTAAAQSATNAAKTQADVKAYVESEKASFIGFSKRETDLKYANAIIGSAEGNGEVTMSDAWNAPMRNLCIYGESRQDKPTGMQLFDCNRLINAGATKKISDGGYNIVVTGTNSNYTHVNLYDDKLIGKTVWFMADNIYGDTNDNVCGQITLTRADGSIRYYAITKYVLKIKIDIPSDAKSVRIGLYTNNTNEVFANTATFIGVRVCLEENADWEPYTGGIPAPNPDFPQAIQSVENPIVVSSIAGRNLIKNSMFENGLSNWLRFGGTWSVVDEKVDELNVVGVDLSSEPASELETNAVDLIQDIPFNEKTIVLNKPYTISFLLNVSVAGNACPFRWYLTSIKGTSTDNRWTPTTKVTNGYVKYSRTIIFTEKHNNLTPKMYFRCFCGSSVKISQPKFELSNIATPWTPALEDVTDINKVDLLPYISKAKLPIVLRRIGVVRDRLCYRSGEWGVVRYCGELVHSAAATVVGNILKESKELRMPNPGIYKQPGSVNIMCDKFIHSKQSTWGIDDLGIFNTAGTECQELAFRVPLDADADTYFVDNPVTVLYELASPTWEPLPDDIQQQLNELITYSGSTSTVYVIGTDIVPDMSVEYVKDTNKVIDDLQGQIDKLTNMITVN
jgi:hypothetical protein